MEGQSDVIGWCGGTGGPAAVIILYWARSSVCSTFHTATAFVLTVNRSVCVLLYRAGAVLSFHFVFFSFSEYDWLYTCY